MYITFGGNTYPARSPAHSKPLGEWFKIYMIDRPELDLPITGTMVLHGDDGFELASIDTADFARQTYAGAVLTLTNEPEPTEEPKTYDIPQEQERQVEAMSAACRAFITRGVDVNGARYSLELEDQLNLMNLQAMILAGATAVPYHANGEACRMYTAEEFNAIANAATTWKLFHESYFNSLRGHIQSLETVEEIWDVRYGMDVPVEHQTDVLKALIAQNPGVDFFPEDEPELLADE